ncbi:MlaE family lipid ABC transporter permease subunit [Sandaracinobacteroides saxicola]|uniref:MlaE family lipid ABC transporter permease subunit n=1 Tax=Sandaracinobacteroides saxicola TaxID=2759707 RepID=A0A7G5IIE6_9SPHN|nr:MlaE family lipid ABC transporter permease subunit [Sandaracinobacteroides saxicola]QMW23138.1 MlaE family lipid ABC transporter permease subunit [Sandaracinobacteroides saxicola]
MTEVEIERRQDDGGTTLALSGRLTVSRAATLDAALADIRDTTPGPITIDLSAISRIDTTGAWVLHKLLRSRDDIRLTHASEQAQRLLEAVAAADMPCRVRPDTRPVLIRALGDFGQYLSSFSHTIGSGLAFLGSVLAALWRVIRHGRGVRLNAITHQMEAAGVNALGIVGLMSFLVGIVLAQQGAVQLRQFGADVFVINLVGRSTYRELGVLLMAIMVAGRSASAFAAQIGSMKLNEEIDAMRTIGLDPLEVLVLPRIIAMVIMMPLLAFYAATLAVAGGGVFAWVSLDIPPVTFVTRLREVVPISDFWIGLVKAPVFGAIIAVTGCFQGMQVSGNAESVGLRTTLAVVQSIFMVIVLDAFFAVFFTALGFA